MKKEEWKPRGNSEKTCAPSGIGKMLRPSRSCARGIFVAVAVSFVLAACSPSPAEIGNKVLLGMQQRFATDPELSKLGISITSVVVVKQSDNKYQGLAIVQYKNIERQVSVEVTAQGDNVIWKTDPDAFMFVIQHELQQALGQQ